MSVINKIPMIQTILGALTEEQVATLRTCINGQGPAPVFRTLKAVSTNKFSVSDKGIKPIQLELKELTAGSNMIAGYLIYTDDVCAVICYAAEEAQGLVIANIDTETFDVTFEVAQHLSILELRSELDDILGAGSSAGTVVEANPEGEATGTLESIGIDGAKYSVPAGGTKLYKHSMYQGGGATIEFISTDLTPKSFSNIVRVVSVSDSGGTSAIRETVNDKVYAAKIIQDLVHSTVPNNAVYIRGVFECVDVDDNTVLYINKHDSDTLSWYTNSTDTVTEL